MSTSDEKEALLGRNGIKKFSASSRKHYTFAIVVAAISVLGIIGFVYDFKSKESSSSEQTDDDGDECSYSNYTLNSCNDPQYPVLEGADVVAYFDDDATSATIGTSVYSSTYRGYLFYFESEENREIFDSDPHHYAPKYGGFCAFGLTGEDPKNTITKLSQLYTVPSNLDTFTIRNDRLYMFRGEGAQELFLEDFDELSSNSDEMWASWFGEDCDGFYNSECFKT